MSIIMRYVGSPLCFKISNKNLWANCLSYALSHSLFILLYFIPDFIIAYLKTKFVPHGICVSFELPTTIKVYHLNSLSIITVIIT